MLRESPRKVGHKPSCISTKHQQHSTPLRRQQYYRWPLLPGGSTRSASITAEEQQGPRLKERHVPHGNQSIRHKTTCKKDRDDTKEPIHVVRIQDFKDQYQASDFIHLGSEYHSRSSGTKAKIHRICSNFANREKSNRRQAPRPYYSQPCS
ncbi:hypothetical protein Nepgr_022854 [Nepenthes gracilis]|uniref:Uncharacterized protein n=1 Tax=Nepenthes gracilis TaxID=150966 RepID=A0AAD3XX69_NEPGR|nr:hypothetical protein Nepgr_022854 [Nepenthes gracilis]